MSPPKIGNETRMSPLFTSVQRGTGGPTRDSWARKERKGTRTGKEEAKLSLFTEDMTSCTENPNVHTDMHTHTQHMHTCTARTHMHEEAVPKRQCGTQCLST